jgi:hypothetical protein
MARRAIELAKSADLTTFAAIARSRTEPASRVQRARMLPSYRDNLSFATGQAIGVHHQTVQRCIERALAYGPIAALDGTPVAPFRDASATDYVADAVLRSALSGR